MNRRRFLAGAGGTVAAGSLAGSPTRRQSLSFCDCALQPQAAVPQGAGALAAVGSKVRITNLKTFGVTIPGAPPDRPYVFVKLETNEGLIGWGEGTLEGKAGAVLACINDFREFVRRPIAVEHTGNQPPRTYRRPVIGSAISRSTRHCGICAGDSGFPVYKLLGGPNDRSPRLLRANARTLDS